MHPRHSSARRARGRTPFLAAAIGLFAAAVLAASGIAQGADPATSAPAPSGAGAQAPPAAAATSDTASSPAGGPASLELPLQSQDGHKFSGLYLAPSSPASSAILIVPDLGQKRDHFLRLTKSLRARGYRVLSMDNTGQLRHVARGPNATPTFTPMTTKILGVLVQDVSAGIAGLRAQPGVGRIALLGFGIGGNASLLAAGADSSIAAVGIAIPNYGCEEFDPYAAFGNLNARPVLLLESKKKYQSDISVAFETIMAKRKDLPYQHVALRRDPEAVTQQDLEEDYEESLLAWLDKAFPPASH